MIQTDTVVYSGGNIIITESELRVKNRLYQLNRVRGYWMFVHDPDRKIGTILAISGIFILAADYSGLIPSFMFGYIFWLGILSILGGTSSNFISRRKYAIRISTALGNEDVVISTKREIIIRAVEALDKVYWARATRKA